MNESEARLMATPDEMYDEAVALKEDNKLDAAIAKLTEILALDANHVLAHSALAVNLQKTGRLDEAIQHAIRVTELEPDDPFSFTQLSVIFQRCGRIPEAETAMYRARAMSGHTH
jgi:Flp pilus assembly protein TadD